MNLFHIQEPFIQKSLVLALMLLGAVSLGAIAYLAIDQLLIILFAVILAIPVSSVISFITRKLRCPRSLIYVLFWICILAVSSALVYLGANSVASEVATYNELVADFSVETATLPTWLPQSVVSELQNINVISIAQNGFESSSLSNTASSIFSGITGLLILVVLVAYLSFNPQVYSRGLISVTPHSWQKTVKDMRIEVPQILNRWILSRLISMVGVGVLTYVGLLFLGVEAALVLAVAAALLSFVPNLGPILAAIPAILIALPQGFSMVAWIIGLYALVQFLESYLITPVVQKKAVRIHPALLLSVQIVLGATFGLMGLLLAGPLLAIAVGMRKARSVV